MTQGNNALVKHAGEGPGPGDFLRGPVSIPPSDVSEDGEAYYVYLDMPGARKDGIVVTVAGGILVVRAPIAPVHVNDAAVLYREIPVGMYERRFALGRGIDRNTIGARYVDGVLTVRLQKTEESKPKQINVTVK